MIVGLLTVEIFLWRYLFLKRKKTGCKKYNRKTKKPLQCIYSGS